MANKIPDGGGRQPQAPTPKVRPRKRTEKGNGYAFNPRTNRGS